MIRQSLSAQPSIRITLFRAIFFCVGLIALSEYLGAELSWIGIFGAAVVGSLLGRKSAITNFIRDNSHPLRLSHRGFSLLTALVVISWLTIRFLGDQLNPGAGAFSWYVLSRSIELYLALGLGLAVFEWLYRRTESWLSVEIFSIATVTVCALSSHRYFRLDSPRSIASLAWDWNANPIGVFILVGGLLAAVLVGFGAICSKPKTDLREPLRRKSIITGAVAALTLIGIIGFVGFHFTTVAAGSRLMNGVGQNNQEGVSPLTFQSALGATNQPSAVVRLEGDYKDNPHTPMLYLREDALSEFNGSEMVHAGNAYDRDVITTPPSMSFKADEDATLEERIPLSQSVYLLADHKIPFAIDFPISLAPLKNPNPSKFKGGAYRVYSQVPVYKLDQLSSASVGNPAWDEIERQHYLKTNQDPRYQEKAVEITREVTAPIERAFALAGYLSKKSIYTLAPNHAETTGDLTAPYLFGDMRGYCVHFAHAMVYMLRSIGIPSRIGTGYLTDLSQSKDGHILLRMSDRHAWAEVYITSKGWVPFDVQPEQVESHGDSEVDQKLLEDLMSQLDPGEEILPKEPSRPEPSLTKEKPIEWSSFIPKLTDVLISLGAMLALVMLFKAFLKNLAWRLPLSPQRKTTLAYRAEVMNVADWGITRAAGETRTEFERRVNALIDSRPLSLTTPLNELRFNSAFQSASLKPEPRLPSPNSFVGKIKSFLSPLSIRRFFAP